MISCIPWEIWKYEIKILPVSSKTLFARRGIEIEKLEEELKLEGYIHMNDNLLEILKNIDNLSLTPFTEEVPETSTLGDFPEEWTEEDFLYNGFGI
jgi:hypothetical protein